MKKVVRKKVNGKDHSEIEKEVSIEKNLGGGDKESITLKERKPERSTPDIVFREGTAKVGLAKGMTVNLGNYSSARIDCSITRIVPDEDRAIMDELANLSVMLDEQIEFELEELDDKEQSKPKKRNK